MLYSIKQVEKKMKKDAAFAETVKEIKTNINSKRRGVFLCAIFHIPRGKGKLCCGKAFTSSFPWKTLTNRPHPLWSGKELELGTFSPFSTVFPPMTAHAKKVYSFLFYKTRPNLTDREEAYAYDEILL